MGKKTVEEIKMIKSRVGARWYPDDRMDAAMIRAAKRAAKIKGIELRESTDSKPDLSEEIAKRVKVSLEETMDELLTIQEKARLPEWVVGIEALDRGGYGVDPEEDIRLVTDNRGEQWVERWDPENKKWGLVKFVRGGVHWDELFDRLIEEIQAQENQSQELN